MNTTMKEETMLSNLLFRFNQLITRWLYRDHHKYKNRGLNQDD